MAARGKQLDRRDALLLEPTLQVGFRQGGAKGTPSARISPWARRSEWELQSAARSGWASAGSDWGMEPRNPARGLASVDSAQRPADLLQQIGTSYAQPIVAQMTV